MWYWLYMTMFITIKITTAYSGDSVPVFDGKNVRLRHLNSVLVHVVMLTHSTHSYYFIIPTRRTHIKRSQRAWL